MPFDREGAKAAGYSDEEIESYLSSKGAAPESAQRGAAPTRAGMSPPRPMGGPGLGELSEAMDIGLFRSELPGLGAGQLAMKGAELASLLPMVGGALMGAGKLAHAPLLKRIPGAGVARGLGQDVAKMMRRGAPKPSPKPAPPVTSRSLGSNASSRDVFPPRMPQPQPSTASLGQAGTTRGAYAPPDLKLVKGSAESRAAARAKPAKAPAKSTPKAPAKSSAKAPAKGSVESRKNWKPRGASRPELERRTTARAKAVGHEPAMGDDIGNQLKKSLEIEAMFEQYGLSQAERAVAREALRRGVLPQF